MYIRINVDSENFSKVKQSFTEYFNRNPDSSTFLFFGSTPVKFKEEQIKIDGHQAVRFLIDKESREIEHKIENTLVDMGNNKTLIISRFLTNTPPTEASLLHLDETYEKIIKSIKIHK